MNISLEAHWHTLQTSWNLFEPTNVSAANNSLQTFDFYVLKFISLKLMGQRIMVS